MSLFFPPIIIPMKYTPLLASGYLSFVFSLITVLSVFSLESSSCPCFRTLSGGPINELRSLIRLITLLIRLYVCYLNRMKRISSRYHIFLDIESRVK